MPRPAKKAPAPRGPGRPPADGVTRDAAVMIRVTPEERERLTVAARRAGLGLAPWLRALGLKEATR